MNYISGGLECCLAFHHGSQHALLVWELGWNLTGICRAIVDVACQRARIQSWPQQDIYGNFFIFGR